MEMLKKFVLVLAVFCAFLGYWLLEPYSLNPWQKLAKIEIQYDKEFSCQGKYPELQEKVNERVEHYLEQGKFLGISAGIHTPACDGLVIGAGYADKQRLTPFLPSTLTRIASVTKPMTAIAIMQLREKGLIDLDTSVRVYLPNLPTEYNAISIKHLLSHTSGVPHYASTLDALSFAHYPTLADAVKEIVKRELVAKPEEQYLYSSFGYTLLGLVIEHVSQMDFETYLQANIWQVAGMKNTALERSHHGEQSRLYIRLGNTFIRSPYTDLSVIYPAGGVLSSASDLIKFGHAVLENKLISRTSLELMVDISQSITPSDGSDLYGLGWSVYHSTKNGRIISHGGAQPGASVHFQILLDKEIVALVASNAYNTKRSAYLLANELGSLVL